MPSFSLEILSSRESKKSSCGTDSLLFFLPHSLQHTKAMPPIRIAPPTPPTTPPTIFLLDVLRFVPSPPPFRSDGLTVAVAKPVVDVTT